VKRRALFGVFVSAALAALVMAQGGGADWKISLEPKGTLKAQTPVPVQVTIKDAKGAPVSGATVEMVLTMVEMDHGETKVPAKQVKAGVYEGKPNFMMDGKWNIEVRAKKGDVSATVKQQVSVAE
jgi:nitrogen fixation protein FixH